MKGDDTTRHSGHQIHPPQQVLEARVVAAGSCQQQGLVDGTGIEAQNLCLCFARNGICIRVNLPC